VRATAGELLLSLHIPKTAGSTLLNALSSWYPEQQRLIVHEGKDEPGLETLSAEQREGLGFVHGHFTYGIHELFDRPSSYICFLRDPVDRLISLYYFIRQNPRHPRHNAVVSSGMSLSEFAISGLSPEIENGQTRMLSGRREVHFVHGRQSCTHEDVARAIANMEERFRFVGTTGQFDKGLFLLAQRLGRTLPTYRRRNVTKARVPAQSLDRYTRSALESVNGFDLELFEYASRRFRRDWRDSNAFSRAAFGLKGLFAGVGGGVG
jgi:hypothetical protein